MPLTAQAQVPEAPTRTLLAGRCQLDLPLDAGQGFDQQRFLVLKDETYLFAQDGQVPDSPWRLLSKKRDSAAPSPESYFRLRKKWRDGALWMMAGTRILRWDPEVKRWIQKADPGLEFMDFEVDMTGRILLVCTADPKTHRFRALLESLDENGSSGPKTSILAPYPDPGCMEWCERGVPPVAAATLQAGYESVQIREFTILFNPLARRLFVFRPLEDRIREVKLGLPLRSYQDLLQADPQGDLCWQVLPGNLAEAWLVLAASSGPASGSPERGGLSAISLNLFEATAGEPHSLPQGVHLPVFMDPTGHLSGLEAALKQFEAKGRSAKAPKP